MMLPPLLTSRLTSVLGRDREAVFRMFSQERVGSFRLNTLKGEGEKVFDEFKTKNIKVKNFFPISGVFLFDRSQEYAIKGTDAFYTGQIYLQSLSSMLPVLVLAPERGETILDVCAAPGSKTTQMAMIMEDEGKIVALEQNQIRYDKLMYNARLQGTTIIEGKKMDARKFLETSISFDRILLDAPCSAEGRIDLRNEKSYGFWSLENIQKKAELQYELLSLAFGRLKKGGTLVYSTCTLAPEENEGVISRFLREYPDALLESIDMSLSGESWWSGGLASFDDREYGEALKKTVRILPSEETEGFFVGKIVRQ